MGLIDRATVDRIYAAADIVEIIGDYVTLKRKGVNYQACCPFHNEKTPSFVVSPSKGVFKCFGCGKAGNAVTFVMEHEGISYPEALKAVAKRYGIEVQERELTEEDIRRAVNEYSVFGRVTPQQKLSFVKALKAQGHTVAMTGDGVNDAPALQKADIGCAMGKSGTDVAKNAADMVLMDDNFATIVDAVEEGRGIYQNIKKAVHFLLSCNIGEVLTMFLGILMGMPVVLLPTQLLLVNLVTDGLPAIALGLEPPEPEAMQKPPRRPDESFFSDGLMGRIFFRGMLIGICTLGAFSAVVRTGGTLEAARTAALCTLILSQLVHVFECKSERRTLFSMPYGNNLWLVGAVLVSVAVLAAAGAVPMLRVIFSTVMLTRPQWYIALGFSLTVPLCSSIAGLFRRKKRD